jgi:predicted DNA-binding protein (UPF0278 family)
MKTVSVPKTLIEMSKLPSLQQKMLLLDTIGTHPIAPYICDGVFQIMDHHMKRNHINEEIHITINHFLVVVAKRFG